MHSVDKAPAPTRTVFSVILAISVCHLLNDMMQSLLPAIYCNSISTAEHAVTMILALVRNYIPSHQWVVKGGWNIADCVARSYDL